MQWQRFEEEFDGLYSEVGRPAKPIRLMVGLMILKQLENLSEEQLVEAWAQNPYYQAFCGETHFQWKLPCDPSDFVYFKKRIRRAYPSRCPGADLANHGDVPRSGNLRPGLQGAGVVGEHENSDSGSTEEKRQPLSTTQGSGTFPQTGRDRTGDQPPEARLPHGPEFPERGGGDAVNLFMTAVAFNFRKWMRGLWRFFALFTAWLCFDAKSRQRIVTI